MKWYGYVTTRSEALTKAILQRTGESKRRRGMPKKSWIDNIAECACKSFAETQAMVHNRQERRYLMRKSVMTRLLAVLRYQGKARQDKARQGKATQRNATQRNATQRKEARQGIN